jgi:hypothetical protein
MMTKNFHDLSRLFSIKGIIHIFLFVYFGSLIVPQWSMFFSSQFLDWFVALPIIVFALVVIGFWGGIGLWRAKSKNSPRNPQHKYFIQLAGKGLLWFCVSVGLAFGTQFAYLHKAFNSDSWKDKTSIGTIPFESPSLRQRMITDVIENVLPNRKQSEVITLLGEPDDSWTEDGVEHILYVLGYERSFGVDYECLTIEYDAKGNFQDHHVFGNCG